MASKNAPVLVIELLDQRSSGWIQEGTERTANPVELRAPQVRFIPNRGYRKVEIPALDREGKEILDENGKKVMTFMNEEIRYIKHSNIISVVEQEKRGIKPSHDAINDKIPVKHARLAVTKEGSLIGLYDFLEQVYYNQSNLDRAETATALFRTIKIDEQAEAVMDNEEQILEAGLYIQTLRDKISQGEYTYKENKIDAVCELMGVVAETYPTKVKSLQMLSKQYPSVFLDKVRKLEQKTVIDVTHALQLEVIKFEGNTALYTNKDKIIKVLGAGKKTHDTKISELADWLRTKDAFEVYQELKIELDIAKEKQLTEK